MKEASIHAVVTGRKLSFYYTPASVTAEPVFLYTVPYYRATAEYFRKPKFESQVLGFKKWGNSRLDHQIEKLPCYIRYAKRELLDMDIGRTVKPGRAYEPKPIASRTHAVKLKHEYEHYNAFEL